PVPSIPEGLAFKPIPYSRARKFLNALDSLCCAEHRKPVQIPPNEKKGLVGVFRESSAAFRHGIAWPATKKKRRRAKRLAFFCRSLPNRWGFSQNETPGRI